MFLIVQTFLTFGEHRSGTDNILLQLFQKFLHQGWRHRSSKLCQRGGVFECDDSGDRSDLQSSIKDCVQVRETSQLTWNCSASFRPSSVSMSILTRSNGSPFFVLLGSAVSFSRSGVSVLQGPHHLYSILCQSTSKMK